MYINGCCMKVVILPLTIWEHLALAGPGERLRVPAHEGARGKIAAARGPKDCISMCIFIISIL